MKDEKIISLYLSRSEHAIHETISKYRKRTSQAATVWLVRFFFIFHYIDNFLQISN